ncbi:MAG: hypothetical protein ACR2IE_03975 [Candidatus Sumerlaeaceae bacterium]
MLKLKPISIDGVSSALERAERYRLLNEPVEAESICLDVLQVDPGNPDAIITLILALTDQFDERLENACSEALALLNRLDDPYTQQYYKGVICERRGKAHLHPAGPHHGHIAHDWYRQAMECFENAEKVRPPDNDDAILRWNTCARTLMRYPQISQREGEPVDSELLE